MRSRWRSALILVAASVACSDGRSSSGNGGSSSAAGGSGAGAGSEGGFGGVAEIPGCNTEGVCRVYSGETCGVCPDCPLDIPECGACAGGVCDEDDACTCAHCTDNSGCNNTCNHDGVCVYYDEGCPCADCTADPLCSWYTGR